jgi:signal transduction histidine kinase
MLLKYGLNTALKEFCDEISRSGVLHITYQPMGLDKLNIDQTTSLAVYRIVQELVHNAIKHASASSVLVQVHAAEQDKLLSITVEDDGKGFVPATLNNVAGIGWINIQNRIDFLKGRLDLSAAPGKGTSVLVEVSI